MITKPGKTSHNATLRPTNRGNVSKSSKNAPDPKKPGFYWIKSSLSGN